MAKPDFDNDTGLPVFFLYRRVLFPHCNLDVASRSDVSRRLKEKDGLVVLPVGNFLGMVFTSGRIGTLAEVVSIKEEGGGVAVQFKGIRRVRVGRVRAFRTAGFRETGAAPEEGGIDRLEELRRKAQELIFLINIEQSDKLITLLEYISDLGQLADFTANYFVLDFAGRRRLLGTAGAAQRARRLIGMLDDIMLDLKKKKGLA